MFFGGDSPSNTDPISMNNRPNAVHFPPPTLSMSLPVAALEREAKIEYVAVNSNAVLPFISWY